MNQASRKPKKTKGLGVGFLAFATVFALFSFIFRPHSLGMVILAFALSGFIGVIVKIMGEGLDLTVKEKVPESLKNMESNTGNPEVDALLEQGREMITQIRKENDLIPEASLSEKLDQLEKQCAEIFRVVYEKPAKASQIRKFMEYYLPTTLKMVTAYRTFGQRNQGGQDIIAARERIDNALGVVLKGCQKMLDNLYRDDVLDITTDIDVLEQMLKRDGLTESSLSIAAAQAKQAAQMDRAVDVLRHQQSQGGTPLSTPRAQEKTQGASDAQATAQMPKKE